MADELSTEEVIDTLSDDNGDIDINDFTDFSDVDISDNNSSEEKETLEESTKENDKETSEKEVEDKESTSEEKTLELDKDKSESEEIKMINAKMGDKILEISPDAVFKHVVDGKEIEVTAQELLNDFSGQKSWNHKFSELGEDKKSFNTEKGVFESQRDDLMTKVNSFVDSVQKEDPVRALESLANLAGTNPVELREYFIDLMRDQAIKYVQLTPEQQKELDMGVKTKYHEDRNVHLEETLKAQTEQNELTGQINTMQQKYSISDEKLVEIHDELKDKSELSLEALDTAMLQHVNQGKASTLLDQVDPSLKENKGYIEQVVDFITRNPDLSDAEVADSIKEAITSVDTEEKTSSASKKLQDKINKNKASDNNQELKESDEDDVVDFDDVSL